MFNNTWLPEVLPWL